MVSSAGWVDTSGQFGIISTYQHEHVVLGIKQGMTWCADNCAFSGSFDPAKFLAWLEQVSPYRDTCLFVSVPDIVGNAAGTQRLWLEWQPKLAGWPLAFVCQDGQLPQDIPKCAAVFIGGTTDWKLSPAALACIYEAQRRRIHVHIGRVNWWKRYAHFRRIPGSDAFTCDGTRQRFDGIERTISAWTQYMNRPLQPELLPSPDSSPPSTS